MGIESVPDNSTQIADSVRFAGIDEVDRDRIGAVLFKLGNKGDCRKWDDFFQTVIDMFEKYHRHDVLPGRIYDKSQDHLADCSVCQLHWQKPLRDNGFPILYELE